MAWVSTAGIIEVRMLKGDRYDAGVVLERDDQIKSTVLAGLEFRVSDVFRT